MEENNATYKDGFAGDRRYLKGFLAKMNLIFMISPDRFQTDEAKVIYIISRLYGNAMNWAASLIENQDPCLTNYDEFISKINSVYGSFDSTFVANQRLRTIRQRRIGDVRNYILEFNRYADESSWNEEAKMDAFLAGLNDQIASRILEMFPGPRSLSAMQTIAARIDSRIAANRNFFNPQNRSNNRPRNNNNKFNKKKWNSNKKSSNPKPHGPLSEEEKERRRRENLCLYCGSSQHSLDNCPLKNKNKNINKNKPSSSSTYISNPEVNSIPRPRISDSNLPIYEFTLNIENTNSTVKILLDTGSQINLMDIYYVKENKIPYSTETNLPKVSGIGGKQTILGKTLPISITYDNHKCKTQFYVVDLPSYCAILGFEWISSHNPNIDFKNKTLKFNSNHCIENCLVIPSSFTTFISEKVTYSTENENIINDIVSRDRFQFILKSFEITFQKTSFLK